jgi:DNA-binding transcriptional ArsR family regulator
MHSQIFKEEVATAALRRGPGWPALICDIRRCICAGRAVRYGAMHTSGLTPGAIGERFRPYRQFLGSIVPEWLERRTELSAIDKLIYGRLARYAGKDGRCFPRIKTLADSLGVSASAVRKHLAVLRGLGLIEASSLGLGMQNEYHFLIHEWNMEWFGRGQGTHPKVGEGLSEEVSGGRPEMDGIRESILRESEDESEEQRHERSWFFSDVRDVPSVNRTLNPERRAELESLMVLYDSLLEMPTDELRDKGGRFLARLVDLLLDGGPNEPDQGRRRAAIEAILVDRVPSSEVGAVLREHGLGTGVAPKG